MLHKYTPHKKLAIATLFVIAVACGDDKVASRSYPVVDSHPVTDINESGATFNGEILDVGTGVVDHGFIYGTIHIDRSTALVLDSISLGPASKAGKFSIPANRNLTAGATYYVRAFATGKPVSSLTAGKTVLGQEISFVSKGGVLPTITDFNPKHANINDMVLIKGSGFSRDMAFNSVFFGEAPTAIVKGNKDSLLVRVPANTIGGDVDIVVRVAGQRVIAAEKFSLVTVTLTSFEPEIVDFGETVTLRGTNFPAELNFTYVDLLGQRATISSSTPGELNAIVPLDANVSSSAISLTVGGQTATLPGPIKIAPPVIDSFSPTVATYYSVVTINGDHFHPMKEKNIVMLGSTVMKITSATTKKLTVTQPFGVPAGTYTLSVKVLDQEATAAEKFQVYY